MCRFIDQMTDLESDLKEQEALRKELATSGHQWKTRFNDPGKYVQVCKQITKLEQELEKVYGVIVEIYG